MITAPAARRRATAGASTFATGASASTLEPARVTSPATSNKSFTETGRPSTAERMIPVLRSRSAWSASARADSAYTFMKARAPSPAGSAIRANACSTSSRLLVLPADRSRDSASTLHIGAV